MVAVVVFHATLRTLDHFTSKKLMYAQTQVCRSHVAIFVTHAGRKGMKIYLGIERPCPIYYAHIGACARFSLTFSRKKTKKSYHLLSVDRWPSSLNNIVVPIFA